MRKFVLALAAIALATPAGAQDPPTVRVLQEGYKAGFRDCAPALEKFVKFIHDDDESYGFVSTWSTEKPNGEMLSALTSESYTDGQGVTTFTGVKTASGDCDVTMTQTLVIPEETCEAIQKDRFKDWKFYSDLNGVNVYEDPTIPNSSVALAPAGKSGCVIVKHVMGFGI